MRVIRQKTDIEYHWSTGPVVGAFLGALREDGRLLASVCSGCGRVSCPSTSYCEACGSETEELREVGPRAVVVAWARETRKVEGLPLETPFRYVLIKPAGADTLLLHVAPDDGRVVAGAVLVPELAEERTGSIVDVRWFRPEED